MPFLLPNEQRCLYSGPNQCAISHATAAVDYQLITTTRCREHGTFHITTGSGTDLAGPGDIKLLNRSSLVFVGHSNSTYVDVVPREWYMVY